MRRKHRHELKQNEFLVWIEETLDWIHRNQSLLGRAILVVVAAVILLGGVSWYRGGRGDEAQRELLEALRVYRAPISDTEEAPGSIVQGTGLAYKSHEERSRDALLAFEAIVDQFPRLDAGRQARFYAALCQADLGQTDEASSHLEEVMRADRDLLHYLASQALANVKREAGDYDGAAELYRRLLADTENPLPKDHLLYNWAQSQEEAGRVQEARDSYQRFLEEFPDSRLRSEVQQRAGLLELHSTD